MPKKSKPWHWLTDDWKGLGLAGFAVIPVVYMAGFIAWSLHALNNNLGFLPLHPAQYLAAGTVAMGLTALVLGLHMIGILVINASVKKHRHLPVDVIIGPSAMTLAGLFVVVLAPLLPLFSISRGEIIWRFLFMGLLHMMAYGLIRFTLPLAHQMTPQDHQEDKQGPPVSRDQHILSGLVVVFTVWLLFAHALLPSMSPEFGGAADRRARLDVDVEQFTPSAIRNLGVADPVNATSGIHTTATLTVMYIDGDRLLVRNPGQGGPQLMELPQHAIKTIHWVK